MRAWLLLRGEGPLEEENLLDRPWGKKKVPSRGEKATHHSVLAKSDWGVKVISERVTIYLKPKNTGRRRHGRDSRGDKRDKAHVIPLRVYNEKRKKKQSWNRQNGAIKKVLDVFTTGSNVTGNKGGEDGLVRRGKAHGLKRRGEGEFRGKKFSRGERGKILSGAH